MEKLKEVVNNLAIEIMEDTLELATNVIKEGTSILHEGKENLTKTTKAQLVVQINLFIANLDRIKEAIYNE